MSYILDALKKIEFEKNRKKRPDGSINLSGDLFNERQQPAAGTGIWKTVMLIAAASLVTCVATWFVLQGNGSKRGAVIAPAAHLPASPVPPLVPEPLRPEITAPSVTPVTSAVAAPAASISRKAAANSDSPAPGAVRAKKRPGAQLHSPKQTVQSVPPPVEIKLSGIAWQEERTARRAVVNGYLLKEGAAVSGARITEINPDMVRFVSPAGLFEIKLDAVLPVEVQR